MSRILVDDTLMMMVHKLAEGNPGAITVMSKMIKYGPVIDPDSILAEFSGMISLDEDEIYGSNIWVLYKDICKEDIVSTLGLLRATQLGYLYISDLKEAISTGKNIDVELYLNQVKDFIPNFGKSLS